MLPLNVSTEGVSNPESIQHLLQECVHPRALLSPSDAEFSAFFVKQIHRLGTPNFWTFMAYDKVDIQFRYGDIGPPHSLLPQILGEHIAALVGQLTEQESNNYGQSLSWLNH
jgi:THO complex subunit 2